MNDFKKNWPIGLIVLLAVIVTGIAGWHTTVNPTLNAKDSWGLYLWFTPLAYLLIAWYFCGTKKLNRPMIAMGAVLVYGLSAILLFAPGMPTGLQWHYPIGAAAILLYFFG